MSAEETSRPAPEVVEAAVEAVLFAAGEPVSPKEIATAFGRDFEEDEIRQALDRLEARLDAGTGGLRLERIAGGFRLATRSEVGGWVRQFFRQRNRTRLSPASLETLAIVAYRQPITGPEIQAIRGVDPGYALKSLLEKRLIRILGRKKVVGNPLLYGTTRHFLVHFGLDRLADLPSIEEFDQFLGGLDAGQQPLFTPPPEDPEAVAYDRLEEAEGGEVEEALAEAAEAAEAAETGEGSGEEE